MSAQQVSWYVFENRRADSLHHLQFSNPHCYGAGQHCYDHFRVCDRLHKFSWKHCHGHCEYSFRFRFRFKVSLSIHAIGRDIVMPTPYRIGQSHKHRKALVPYPTVHHLQHKCAYFCSEWYIVGFGTGLCIVRHVNLVLCHPISRDSIARFAKSSLINQK